jgi:hypothetical protein
VPHETLSHLQATGTFLRTEFELNVVAMKRMLNNSVAYPSVRIKHREYCTKWRSERTLAIGKYILWILYVCRSVLCTSCSVMSYMRCEMSDVPPKLNRSASDGNPKRLGSYSRCKKNPAGSAGQGDRLLSFVFLRLQLLLSRLTTRELSICLSFEDNY